MGHVHLDPVRSMIELLARRFARFDRTIDELGAFRHFDFRRVAFEVVAAGGRDCARDHEHARAGNPPFVDGHLDPDVAIAGAFGLHIANGGETLLERAARGHRRTRGAICQRIFQQLNVVATLRRIFALQKDVGVRVDHAREHGHVRQIDDSRAGGGGHIRPDAFNSISADDDHLIFSRLRRRAVDQSARFDDRYLRTRRCHRKQKNDSQFSHRVRIHSPHVASAHRARRAARSGKRRRGRAGDEKLRLRRPVDHRRTSEARSSRRMVGQWR